MGDLSIPPIRGCFLFIGQEGMIWQYGSPWIFDIPLLSSFIITVMNEALYVSEQGRIYGGGRTGPNPLQKAK